MARSFRVCLLTALAVSTSLASVAAQTRATTADLTGVVLDVSKAVLPGATVTARNQETNLTRSTVTDANGRFSLPALPPGIYAVRADLPRFMPREVPDIVLALGSQLDLALTLTLAGTQESITVVGEAPVVDAQKTVISAVITKRQIDSLPINGRNFMAFSVITPGVTTDRTPQQGASGTSGLTFAGQRARSNNIMVDGLDNNDAIVGAVRATFSQEAVREFQVLISSYSAEFGKASGGVVNIVTKSGTNRMSGNAFVFLRDEALNAKDHFEKFDPAGKTITREKAPYGQKQFGATLGGPLKKNRAFYFLSFERLDIAANNFVTIDDQNILTFAGTPLGTPAQILRDAGFPVQTGNVPYDLTSNQLLVKVDHQINQNNWLTLRFNLANDLNENIEPFGGLVARSRAAALDSSDIMIAGAQTSVWSPKTVNELRFQVANRHQTIDSLDPACGGPCLREDAGGPTLEVLGVASVGRQRFTPQPRDNLRIQVLDTLSHYRGNHQFKAGFDFNYIDAKNRLPLHFGGRYIFAALPATVTSLLGLPPLAISSIQALALGIPARYVQGYGDSAIVYGYQDLSLFAQDDWRLGSRLTAKLGVRYQAQFWPDLSYDLPGYPGSYSLRQSRNDIAPRLAIAWDPLGDSTTSVHGAYGIFYDNLVTGAVGVTKTINGRDGVRTFVASIPTSVAAWRAADRRLPEAAVGPYASLMSAMDPGYKTPYAHHVSAGVDRQLPGGISLSANVVYVHGANQLVTVDYNPVVATLGANRRPEDVNGLPGTSASVLQYTSFGETWYRGLTLSASRRFSGHYQFLASYTLSRAEDHSTDFQSEFIPQNSGAGRNRQDVKGLPIGFNPDDEKGPSVQDQRHRVVLSGVYVLPSDVEVSSIVTVASGRPYNILAGADLNGDQDGGATDRVRLNPADIATSVQRNSGTLPHYATVDLRVSRRFRVGRGVSIEGIFEVFNVFNRTSYLSVNNVFGTDTYPSNPLPTFGQFNQAAPPLQIQLACKVAF